VFKVIAGRLGLACVCACAAVALGFACWASVASAYIYWSNGDASAVGRAELDGRGFSPDYVTGAPHVAGVAVSGQYIYWANAGIGTIGRESLTGAGAPDQTFITGARVPQGLAVDGQYLYWASQEGNSIGRAKLDLTEVARAFIRVSRPFAVAVNGSYIYWSSIGSGRIERADLDGRDVDRGFITGLHQPRGIAIAGQYIYWADSGTGTIGRAELSGTGTPDLTFIKHVHRVYGVAIAGKYIYLTFLPQSPVERAVLTSTGAADMKPIVARAGAPAWVAVATAEPPWTLEFTATPASATIGTSVTITAQTNNILLHNSIRISVAGKVIKTCDTLTCTFTTGAVGGDTTYEAEVGPVHSKPYGKAALVSASATVDRTRPTCTGTKCT
jgi:virginiamycin B lyase